MTILHLSDSHLGYNDLDKVNANGVNVREQDFYDAFAKCIDAAIEHQVDVVIHSGDFFHRPSPPNRPMIFALQQLHRLAEKNIPFVVIAGNHETPKTIYTSPILEAFQTLPNVHPMFGQAYEQTQLGELVMHGLPHINDERTLHEEMDKLAPVEGKFNIIMLHTSIGKEYIMDEYGEQLYPPERIAVLDQFDYVALGHWHNFQSVSKLKAGWYSGSTERMSETEIGKEKGYCLLHLEKGKAVEPTFVSIPTRPWHKIEIKDCQDKTTEAIEDELLQAVSELPTEGAVLTIVFHKIKPLQSISLSNRYLQEKIPGALHLHFKRQFVHEERSAFAKLSEQTESMEELISAFIEENTDEEKRAQTLSTKASYYYNLYQTGEYRNR
ncbi:MAG: exonuclease SbcCD subunit D [Bacteroidota bacterium]